MLFHSKPALYASLRCCFGCLGTCLACTKLQVVDVPLELILAMQASKNQGCSGEKPCQMFVEKVSGTLNSFLQCSG